MGIGWRGHTSVVDSGGDVAQLQGVGLTLHQIWTMHQIWDIHHYLQGLELREAEEADELREARKLKVAMTW
jgi:hypothetical protein